MSRSDHPYILNSDKTITGTLVWYYFVCKREVWLMSREITPDEDTAPLDIGRAVHEIYYRKMIREISMEGVKIDLFKSPERAVCEVKTSSRFIEAAHYQLLYYLFRLKEYGINSIGWILIPMEKKKIRVELNKGAEHALLNVLEEIKKIVEMECPPPPNKTSFCRRCAYREFCWA